MRNEILEENCNYNDERENSYYSHFSINFPKTNLKNVNNEKKSLDAVERCGNYEKIETSSSSSSIMIGKCKKELISDSARSRRRRRGCGSGSGRGELRSTRGCCIDDNNEDNDNKLVGHQTILFYYLYFILMLLVTTITKTTSVGAVDCFKCSSRNGSNPACEDPFHNLNTTKVISPNVPDPPPNVIYHAPCYAGKKGREGLFPASVCIKLTGTFESGETMVVRHCALDSGTLTQDTELGCVQACPEDACNGANNRNNTNGTFRFGFYSMIASLLIFSSYARNILKIN